MPWGHEKAGLSLSLSLLSTSLVAQMVKYILYNTANIL